MDKRVILFFLFITFPVWGNFQSERVAKSMIQAKKYSTQRNWPKIILIAHQLASWGEKPYVEKCIKLAVPIIMGRYSEAGALHISNLYHKINNPILKRKWYKTYKMLKKLKKRRWKKG